MVAFCHMSKEVVTRATEKQGAASVDRSETGAVGQSWGVGEEAQAGPMEQPRPTEGRGWNQLMARWVQQLHRSLTQACPKTGAPGVVWLPTAHHSGPPQSRGPGLGAPGQASCGRPLFSGSPRLSVWPSSLWSSVGCQLELVISSCLPGTDSSLCHFPGSPHISSSLTTHSLESHKTADSKTNKEYRRAALYSGKWQLKGALEASGLPTSLSPDTFYRPESLDGEGVGGCSGQPLSSSLESTESRLNTPRLWGAQSLAKLPFHCELF